MRNTKNYRRYHQIILLMLVVFLVVACSSVPMPTSSPTAVALTPVVKVSAPTNLYPTVTVSVIATDSQPTTISSADVVETDTDQANPNVVEINLVNIKVGDHILTATLAQNSSVDALKQALSKGSITINMHDYGSMEKVGSLGMDLPQNNSQITTEAGDIILYQGSAIVIYYAPNSWNFTRLGKINNVSAEELKEILGDGNVTITISLPQE